MIIVGKLSLYDSREVYQIDGEDASPDMYVGRGFFIPSRSSFMQIMDTVNLPFEFDYAKPEEWARLNGYGYPRRCVWAYDDGSGFAGRPMYWSEIKERLLARLDEALKVYKGPIV